MKRHNFFAVLAFCAGMQSNISFTSQESKVPQGKTYWQQYAPQFMQDASNYLAKKYEDTIGKWTTRRKMVVLSAILVSLVGVYYRNEIIKMITDISAEKSAPIGSGISIAPDLQTLKANYKNAAENYFEHFAEYIKADKELKKAWSGEVGPNQYDLSTIKDAQALQGKVFELEKTDHKLYRKLSELGYQLKKAGMSEDEITNIYVTTQEKFNRKQ